MKRTAHELANPIIGRSNQFFTGRREEKPRPVNPDSIKQRCLRDGVKKHPATIISHMKRHNLTYEEAIAYVPQTHRKAGKTGKKLSFWSKITPGSPREHEFLEGKAKSKSKEEE